MGRFINPFTDFGFKFLFGREVEKELLIDFLNDLLVGEHVITDIQFLNNEQQPEVKTERGLIYDIYCVTDTGERIIVEMQNREQPYFKDRALFYLSRAITQQARKGIWNFQLDAVYGVFFMNFVMDKDIPSKIRTDIVLSDRDTGKLFSNKFRQIFIELPNFNKEEDECENDAVFKYVWIFIHRCGCWWIWCGYNRGFVAPMVRICSIYTAASEPFSQRNQKTGSVSLFSHSEVFKCHWSQVSTSAIYL